MQACRVTGRPVPSAMVGELADSAGLMGDPPALRARLQEDGYLFLKGVLSRAAVMEPDLGRCWKSVSEGPNLRASTLGQSGAP